MRLRYIIKPTEKGYALTKEGELWEAKFTSIQDALRHASHLPNSLGATVVVMNERGVPGLELEL